MVDYFVASSETRRQAECNNKSDTILLIICHYYDRILMSYYKLMSQ